MRDLPKALLDVALYDATAKAAVEAIRHGADPVEALVAAVVTLAGWKREWSPEALRAMTLRPPAPIHMCCAGKHDIARAQGAHEPAPPSVLACDCAAKNIACIHGRAFEGAKLAARPSALANVTPLHGDAPDGEAAIAFAPDMEGVLCLAPDERGAFLCGREKPHREGGGHVFSVRAPVLTREEAIARCARAGAAAAEEIGLHGYQGRADDEQAAKVLAGDTHLVHQHFIRAVLAEARRLVAAGECPALANEPALRGGA